MSLIIITFNIGGKIYQVSKDLLNKHPNTMLCTVASEIETSNHDEPIFIDGNSERFPYVLDYMRHQELELPSHIGKKIFIKDLDYYGFQNIKLQGIDTLLQKTKREERLELIVSRSLNDRINISRNGRFSYGPNIGQIYFNCIQAIEIGLYILWDSEHDQHEQYCSTLTSMLSKHNASIEWTKADQQGFSAYKRDGKTLFQICTR